MPAVPDTRIPVPTISSGVPANPELDRMFSAAAIETTKVPKPKRTKPMFRYFRVAIFLGDSNSEFLLTNHAIREVPPVMPRIVVNSVPIIFSRTTATRIQGSATQGRRSSFLVLSGHIPQIGRAHV